MTELDGGINAKYVEPQPYWRLHKGDSSFDLHDYQMFKIVNAFLKQNLLGEVIEDWTVVGKTYRYQTQSEKLREKK